MAKLHSRKKGGRVEGTGRAVRFNRIALRVAANTGGKIVVQQFRFQTKDEALDWFLSGGPTIHIAFHMERVFPGDPLWDDDGEDGDA